jgi:hypothetical protein
MTRRGLPVSGLVLLLTGCGGLASSASSPVPTASVTAAPSPSASLIEPAPAATLDFDLGLGPSTVAEATADGIPVRVAPAEDAPFMAVYSAIDVTRMIDPTATLSAGQVVLVHHGPIVIDGQPWFLVRNVDLAHPNERWDDQGHGVLDSDDPNWFSQGWVLGAKGTTPFLSPTGEPSGADAYALLEGIGDGASAPFEFRRWIASVDWIAAAVDGGSCDIRISVEPDGVTVVDRHITGVGAGFTAWPRGVEDVTAGEHSFSIESDCSWSFKSVPLIG